MTKALPNGFKPNHRKALHYSAVADAIAKVQASDASQAAKLAFEFMVLAASRSGEVRNATWSEIDFKTKVWTVPGERMKAGEEHRVPLSTRAMEILAEARKLHDGDLVFPYPATGKAIDSKGLGTNLMRGAGIDATAHGFRSSFRDWASELSGASHDAMERALAHVVRRQAEAAYHRTDLLEQRRALMQAWTDYLTH